MKRVMLLMSVLVALISVVSATASSTDFSDWNIVPMSADIDHGSFVWKDANGNFWDGNGRFTSSTQVAGVFLTDSKICPSVTVVDAKQGLWVGASNGLWSIHGTDTVKVALDNNYILALGYSAADNVIVAGTLQGVRAIKLDNDCRATDNIKSSIGEAVHAVSTSGKQICATNTSRVHYSANGETWKVFDSSSTDGVVNHPASGAVDQEGNFWIGCSERMLNPVPYLAKFNGTAWEKISPGCLGAGDGAIAKIGIDVNGVMWIMTGVYFIGIDLTSLEMVKKAPLDGTAADWLKVDGIGYVPPMNIKFDGGAIVGGVKVFAEAKSPTKVNFTPVIPRISQKNFSVIGSFDPLGRRVVINSNPNSFSFNGHATGIFIKKLANGQIEKKITVR